MRIGIRGKLVTTLIITGVIPLLIAISITFFVGIRQSRETIGPRFQQLSEKARESIVLRLTASVRAIRNLAVLPLTVESLSSATMASEISPKISAWETARFDEQWPKLSEEDQPLKGILENPLAEMFTAFNSVENAFGEVFATDATGRLVAATEKTTDYWQADEDWWQKAYNDGQGQLHLSGVSLDESVGIYSTDICVPVKAIRDGQERVAGIIKGVLDASYVFEGIYDIDVAEGGISVLASDDGTIILGRYLLPLQKKLPPGVLPSISRGGSNWFTAEVQDGPDLLVGFARIELNERDFSFSTPWLVIVYQDVSHAFAPVRRLIWYISLPGAALILIFFFLGLYLVEGVVASPLSLLTQTVKRVARGDLTRRVQVSSKDEIGELASSFNQMVSNLEKRTSLDNMSLDMLSHLELSDVLSITMETLRTAFDAAFARIWVVGDGDLCDECIHADICKNRERCLHLKVTVGIYAKDEEYLRVPLGGLKVGWIAETRKPSMTNDLIQDEQLHNSEWLHERWLVSFAGYPLVAGKELLGVMALCGRRAISREEFMILGSFANRTAMAIQNAGLHSDIRELNLNLERKVEERTAELEMANVKLRRADQLKSEFLANMSHELRTPLNAIIGFAEVLRDGLCGELNREQMESVIDIHESGKHLLQMINDILDLSKVEAGKMELQLEKFSLPLAMNDVQSIVRDMVSKKHLSLQVNVPEDSPDVHADQVKFKQIMYNLLSNAVKFTPDGGSIVVDVALNNYEFLISVTDTGIGIAPEHQATIFDEFKQLDSSRSRRYEGTGLGLALTKRLVELHGGRIWVESEGAGMGSKFSFTLPAGKLDVETHRRKLEKLAIPSERPLEKIILVVEDNQQAAQLLCIYLTEAGYNTVVATDGNEAVEMAREVKPFAITLDIMLPEKDGWQVMQELKRSQDTHNIPVIIISVVDDQSFGFSMGAVGYLIKPIDKEQLTNTLDKLELATKTENAAPRTLVIDDRMEDLKLMGTILHNEGFRVLEASSGAEGVAKAIKERPDLIILDLLMPGMSGFDVVKALQGHPETRDIPIIICSAAELTPEDKEILNTQVKSIVRKGEDAKTHLLEAVRKIERCHPKLSRRPDKLSSEKLEQKENTGADAPELSRRAISESKTGEL